MTLIQAKGVRHQQVCVRCGALSDGPYCRACKPANYDPSKPFSGGQGATRSQRAQRRRILVRDRHRCRYCGESANQVHHVTAQSRGGKDTEENLVAICGPCNLRLGVS